MDEEKPEITPISEASGQFSSEQAKALALLHARGNPDFYGSQHSDGELVWEVAGAGETEDHYEVDLTYRPSRGFRGKPGTEHFIIHKAGSVEFRQILTEPQPSFRLNPILAVIGLLVVVAGTASGLASTGGIFTFPDSCASTHPCSGCTAFLGFGQCGIGT